MEQANVHAFVDRLAKGWDTPVWEGGASLSGGQRQCIAIARAILSRPSCLILDEATSAMDPGSEGDIHRSIETLRENHTIIAIAHRLHSLRSADAILVMDHGQFVQEGSYEELASRSGLFRDLLTASAGAS